MLLELWQRVETCLQAPKVPSLVYKEPDLLERTVRDVLTDEIDEIVVDHEEAYKRLRNLLKTIVGSTKSAEKVYYYAKATPIFEYFKVKDQISNIFKREVQLPSGGYICVDETEAMIAIDVNTGKAKNKSQPEAILQTNLEAATEVARQLRLRNIGGLVVIDFIDMRSTKDRDTIYKHVRKLVKNDRAKTYVLPISKLGLMEMTRQREQESLKDAIHDLCPYCHGSGRVKSALSMSVEIQRRLHEVLRRANQENISVRVIMHPTILARLKNEDAGILLELEQKHGKNLSFRADPDIHLEEFKLVDPATGAE